MSGSKHFIMFFYYAHTQCKFCSSVSAAEVNIVQYGTHIDPGTFPKPIQEDSSTILLAKHTSYPRACKWFRQLTGKTGFFIHCTIVPEDLSELQVIKNQWKFCVFTHTDKQLCVHAYIDASVCTQTSPWYPPIPRESNLSFDSLKQRAENSHKNSLTGNNGGVAQIASYLLLGCIGWSWMDQKWYLLVNPTASVKHRKSRDLSVFTPKDLQGSRDKHPKTQASKSGTPWLSSQSSVVNTAHH